jgi:hypothetical protein
MVRLYSAQISQAALANQPVPAGSLNTFTLGGAPAVFVVTLDGVPTGTTGSPVLLNADMGWNLYTTKLSAPVKAEQIIVITADADHQVYRVTYGEYQSYVGLVRMWGMLRL